MRKRNERNARIPGHKTLAEFDFAFQPSIPKREILELETLRFIESHENVVLLGPPGLGKTHIAMALAYEAAVQGKDVLFTTAQDLIHGLYAAMAHGTVKQKLWGSLTSSRSTNSGTCRWTTRPATICFRSSQMPTSAKA